MTDITLQDTDESLFEDVSEDDLREERSQPERIELADEPLFVWLLRQAVAETAPDDPVLRDYVDAVTGPLSEHLALAPAKGGQAFIAARLAEGKTAADVAHYQAQQSLRAHLVNGLLPAARIAHALAAWEVPRFHYWDETLYRLFCAGFTLHDWVKLPDVDEELAARGLSHDRANAARHLATFENIFRQWSVRLGLDTFLEPIGGLDLWLHDVIFLAVNTQVKWGTMLNVSALPGLRLAGRARDLAADLCTLADRVAYIARTPVAAATSPSLAEPLRLLSDGTARFVYHHIAENRGVLTNFIHNAALAALTTDNCLPLLFAPSGVVYLARGAVVFPSPADVATATVQRVREACAGRLRQDYVGLMRSGKGLKTAAYYDLLLTPADQVRLIAGGVFRRVADDKKVAVSGQRYAKIAAKGWLSAGRDLDLPADVRADQLAEFCALATSIASEAAPGLDANALVLRELGISDAKPAFDELTGAKGTGGAPYHWYYAAGAYLKHGGRGRDPGQWRQLIESVGEALAVALEQNSPDRADDGWGDARDYVGRVLSFGPAGDDRAGILKQVGRELTRYQGAKRAGRQATTVCSLCSSAYTVAGQREAGLLFAPQVYSNKQPLHGSKAIRNICLICETEMMLRQILMNRGNATGGRFEGRKVRYLFLYPTYFFTPETMAQLGSLYSRLRRISFSGLRKAIQLESDAGPLLHVSAGEFQRLQDLLMTPEPPESDPLFRLHFSERDPITFFFLGLPPPGRDAKDAEAWINAAWIALLLPLALDVKVVATESPLPLLHEADELDETVFLDAPHDFVSALVGRERVPLEGLLPRLQRLTVAYMIHMDGNADLRRGEYNWHRIPLLARRLAENPLWAAAYLKRWQRGQDRDDIPTDRANLYRQYISILEDNLPPHEGVTMTHARQLTELYRQFYRARRSNSNSILRPIAIASRTILNADPRLFPGREGLVEAVVGALTAFMERVQDGSADGRLAIGSTHESRQAAVRAFADYFVGDIYFDTLNGDASALRGKQLNLLKNACEVIYRDEENRFWRERNAAPPQEDDVEDNAS